MYTPDMVALERLYFNTNQKTAMAVAEVRGALMYCTTSKNVPLHEYTPAQIKMAVTSWGKATKHDVTNMVRRLIRIEKEIRYDDEYDAIALGITHLAHMRHGI
jgi:crossover junction endodeoxyribonuclease RuvC